MKHNPTRTGSPYFNRPRRIRGSTRTILLVLVAFALGLGGGAFWFYGKSGRAGGEIQPAPSVAGALSPATLDILQRLSSPVQIHFYSILDPKSISAAEKDLASRTDLLLAQYESAANGRITLTRYDASSDMGPQEAAKDGITPFNLAKGDACYLGIAVLGNDRKEAFARLSPEWEAALESDLSRAIARVSSPKSAPAAAVVTAPDQATVDEVKAALPNLATISVEQGTQILREAALKQAQTAVQESSAQIQAAQKRLIESRAGGSEAEQQAALNELQRTQAEQAKRLQNIAEHLQRQLETLTTLKSQ